MENMQKALIMAGSVFMFVIALSVAMYSYTVITDVIDTILTTSDYNARSAEYFIEDTIDTIRYASKAEVIMTIMSMKGNDYSVDKVLVDGLLFEKTGFNSADGTDKIETNLKNIHSVSYAISYDFDKNVAENPEDIADNHIRTIKFSTIVDGE